MSGNDKLKSFTDTVATDLKAGKKPTIINKYLKNFFFKSLRSRPEVKEVEKQLGTIDNVVIIISKTKNILRVQSGEQKKDIPFTEEEMQKFLKSLNVKQSTVDECKSIFVMLNFKTQIISIQQNRLDGTQKNIDI